MRSPSTGFVPGSAWNRCEAPGSMALPAIQRASPAGYVGDDDHVGEAFAACGEQTRAGQTLGAETGFLHVCLSGPLPGAYPSPSRAGRAGADAP